ncbi:MAG: hypothetical protein FWC81_01325 [Coriobacteriia bacterium]|nr:hypothetical protein [Coriobacteriia bacterium]
MEETKTNDTSTEPAGQEEENSVMSDSPAATKLAPRATVFDNNLRALAIHGVALLIFTVITIIEANIPGFSLPSLAWTFALLLIMGMYVFLANRFLLPISTVKNVLSVIYLPILLVVVTTAHVLLYLDGVNLAQGVYDSVSFLAFALNVPAIFIVVTVSGFFTTPGVSFGPVAFIMLYIAALLPPLLMYAGLCLRAWRSKGKTAAEATDSTDI